MENMFSRSEHEKQGDRYLVWKKGKEKIRRKKRHELGRIKINREIEKNRKKGRMKRKRNNNQIGKDK